MRGAERKTDQRDDPGGDDLPSEHAHLRSFPAPHGGAKEQEYRDFFRGNLDPYRAAFAEGRDLVLNPRRAGPPLSTLLQPYAEIGGEAPDLCRPRSCVYPYTVKAE